MNKEDETGHVKYHWKEVGKRDICAYIYTFNKFNPKKMEGEKNRGRSMEPENSYQKKNRSQKYPAPKARKERGSGKNKQTPKQ